MVWVIIFICGASFIPTIFKGGRGGCDSLFANVSEGGTCFDVKKTYAVDTWENDFGSCCDEK